MQKITEKQNKEIKFNMFQKNYIATIINIVYNIEVNIFLKISYYCLLAVSDD